LPTNDDCHGDDASSLLRLLVAKTPMVLREEANKRELHSILQESSLGSGQLFFRPFRVRE
jgi:hypothetical protein